MNKKRLFVAVSDSQDRPSSSPCRPNLCKLVHVGLATNDDRTVSLSLCYNKSPAAVDLLLRSRLLNVESKSFQFIMETEGLERKKEGTRLSGQMLSTRLISPRRMSFVR